jgi:hypothetical protein
LSTAYTTEEQLHIHDSALCLLTQAIAWKRTGDAESLHDGILATSDVEMLMTASREWRLF